MHRCARCSWRLPHCDGYVIEPALFCCFVKERKTQLTLCRPIFWIGNFDINNCTQCIKDNLPSAATDQAAASNTTDADPNTDAAAGAGNDDTCTTVDGVLCETLEACAGSCAGSFCDNAFKDLLVCEANVYVPDCNLTADTCEVPAAADSGAMFLRNGMVLTIGLAVSVLWNVLS
jgi:hypothetical protein